MNATFIMSFFSLPLIMEGSKCKQTPSLWRQSLISFKTKMSADKLES